MGLSFHILLAVLKSTTELGDFSDRCAITRSYRQVLFIANTVLAKDVDGKEYIDFTCMLGVVNQGHSHPRILEAVTKQLQEGKELLTIFVLNCLLL